MFPRLENDLEDLERPTGSLEILRGCPKFSYFLPHSEFNQVRFRFTLSNRLKVSMLGEVESYRSTRWWLSCRVVNSQFSNSRIVTKMPKSFENVSHIFQASAFMFTRSASNMWVTFAMQEVQLHVCSILAGATCRKQQLPKNFAEEVVVISSKYFLWRKSSFICEAFKDRLEEHQRIRDPAPFRKLSYICSLDWSGEDGVILWGSIYLGGHLLMMHLIFRSCYIFSDGNVIYMEHKLFCYVLVSTISLYVIARTNMWSKHSNRERTVWRQVWTEQGNACIVQFTTLVLALVLKK